MYLYSYLYSWIMYSNSDLGYSYLYSTLRYSYLYLKLVYSNHLRFAQRDKLTVRCPRKNLHLMHLTRTKYNIQTVSKQWLHSGFCYASNNTISK